MGVAIGHTLATCSGGSVSQSSLPQFSSSCAVSYSLYLTHRAHAARLRTLPRLLRAATAAVRAWRCTAAPLFTAAALLPVTPVPATYALVWTELSATARYTVWEGW